MKHIIKYLTAAAIIVAAAVFDAQAGNRKKDALPEGPEIPSQWQGKKVAYLGDSIIDKRQVENGTNDTYWNMFKDILGIEPYVYGISGNKVSDIIGQARKLEEEHGQDFDAIIILIGTNDYISNVPLGEWFTYEPRKTNYNGQEVIRKHREFSMEGGTFKGRINVMMDYLKGHFPTKQIILLTPLHRGYSKFNEGNVQPEESFANGVGHFIEEYVEVIKEMANIWAVPVIDLNSVSGLFPMKEEYLRYFRKKDTDQLHPNTEGHRRMAYSIAYQLLGYPAKF